MDTRTGVYVTDLKNGTGDEVIIHGIRNGFTYITIQTGPNAGVTLKVPSSWVRENAA